MSHSKIGTQLGRAEKFSNHRCVKCHSYLVPIAEERMDLLNFTLKQKRKVREHKLTHFCPRCMRGYQREDKPLSEESKKPLPFADVVKSFEANVVDDKGRIHRIVTMDRSLLHHEQVETKRREKNPDLVFIGRLNRDKIYYNPIYEQTWLLRLKPDWVQNKRIMKADSWNRLEHHDLETMLAFGLVWYRNFKPPLKQRIYIRQPVFRRMAEILNRHNQWERA